MEWIGHIDRKEVKKICESKLEGKRIRNPTLTWMEDAERDPWEIKRLKGG